MALAFRPSRLVLSTAPRPPPFASTVDLLSRSAHRYQATADVESLFLRCSKRRSGRPAALKLLRSDKFSTSTATATSAEVLRVRQGAPEEGTPTTVNASSLPRRHSSSLLRRGSHHHVPGNPMVAAPSQRQISIPWSGLRQALQLPASTSQQNRRGSSSGIHGRGVGHGTTAESTLMPQRLPQSSMTPSTAATAEVFSPSRSARPPAAEQQWHRFAESQRLWEQTAGGLQQLHRTLENALYRASSLNRSQAMWLQQRLKRAATLATLLMLPFLVFLSFSLIIRGALFNGSLQQLEFVDYDELLLRSQTAKAFRRPRVKEV